MTKKTEIDAGTMAHKNIRLTQKSVTDTGEFEGYGSVFGNEDSAGDIVAQGAFAASLAEHKSQGTMPALLWQHDSRKPIGVYTEMREDSRGLFVKGKLELDTQLGREAHVLLKAGALNGLSIGYMIKRWERSEEDDNIWTLLELDLWECSIVTFPANEQARVSGVKMKDQASGLATWKQYETFLREEGGFSKEAAAAMAASARRIRDNERDAREAMKAISATNDRLTQLLSN